MPIIRDEKTTMGFTRMSNNHFHDRRLTYKAKGLLSLMLSLREDWNYSLNGLASLSADGITSLRTAFRELEECGYVTRERKRDAHGKVADWVYTIYEKPQSEPNQGACGEKPYVERPHAENPHVGQNTQLNTKQLKTKESITKSINLTEVRARLEYESILVRFPHRKREIDGLMDLITDTLNTSKNKIYFGELRSAQSVKNRLAKLNSEYICEVLKKFLTVQTRIKNPENYLLKMLYMQPVVSDLEISNRVKADMSGQAD